MALRPQCYRMAVSYFKETSFGVAFNNSAIDKAFEVDTPALLGVTQTREDDAAIIKGHEFPADTAVDIVAAQDIQVPLAFRGNLSVLGWLFALATGADSVTASSPDYVHTFKVMDGCISDQLPSSEMILGSEGSKESLQKVKGGVVNEARVVIDKPGIVTVSGTVFTDGSMSTQSSYTFPATTSSAGTLKGIQADFKMGNYGSASTITSKKTILMSAEFGINNNLDVADGRLMLAAAGIYLSSLRFGNRAVTMTVRVQGHQGDEFWVAWQADTVLDIELRLDVSASQFMSIRMHKAKIASITQSFQGIRDQNEITFKAFYETSDLSPFVITVANSVAAYLLPVTAGM
jgi:hypothetical protein